jgi:hypothetical protein
VSLVTHKPSRNVAGRRDHTFGSREDALGSREDALGSRGKSEGRPGSRPIARRNVLEASRESVRSRIDDEIVRDETQRAGERAAGVSSMERGPPVA